MKTVRTLLVLTLLLALVGCNKNKEAEGGGADADVKTKYEVMGRLVLKAGNFMLLESTEGDRTLLVSVDSTVEQSDSIYNEDIIAVGYDQQDGDTINALSIRVLEHWIEGIVVSVDEHSIVIVSDVDSFKFSIDKALIYGESDIMVGADVIVYYPNTFEIGAGGDIPATRVLIE
ncbi:MAG: hypothetical protein Q4D14_00510 [Bacteroidales bacterium]|nr:hypothetical protein [Bacteroidales bacterium]